MKLQVGLLLLAFCFILNDTFKIKQNTQPAMLSDESLLIRRADTIGIIENDRTIRKALSRAALDKLSTIETEVTEKTLLAFYHSHISLFEREAKIHLQQFYIAKPINISPDIERKYHNARIALEQNQPVRHLDPAPITLPDTMLPLSLVYRSLGPIVTAKLLDLQTSEISPLIEDETGYYFFYCQARIPAKTLSYDASKSLVKTEYKRRTKDKKLRTALARLWQDAKIIIPEDFEFNQEDLQSL